jgi:hypothetical protein
MAVPGEIGVSGPTCGIEGAEGPRPFLSGKISTGHDEGCNVPRWSGRSDRLRPRGHQAIGMILPTPPKLPSAAPLGRQPGQSAASNQQPGRMTWNAPAGRER